MAGPPVYEDGLFELDNTFKETIVTEFSGLAVQV
jgi:hypothetical protein